jgi:hypothetical protein
MVRKLSKYKCNIFFFNERLTDLTSSEAGLIISSAIASTSAFSWCVKQATELHNIMIATERVIEYSKLTPEAPLESSPGICLMLTSHF